MPLHKESVIIFANLVIQCLTVRAAFGALAAHGRRGFLQKRAEVAAANRFKDILKHLAGADCLLRVFKLVIGRKHDDQHVNVPARNFLQ